MPRLRKRIVGGSHPKGARIGKGAVSTVSKPTHAAGVYLFYRPHHEEELMPTSSVTQGRSLMSCHAVLTLLTDLLRRFEHKQGHPELLWRTTHTSTHPWLC